MSYTIKIVRYRDVPDSVYIGRGSIFGNPFVIDRENSRNKVCDMYESYFANKISTDPEFLKEVFKLHYTGMSAGTIVLGCFCAPKRCHGETIKRFLEDNSAMFLDMPN